MSSSSTATTSKETTATTTTSNNTSTTMTMLNNATTATTSPMVLRSLHSATPRSRANSRDCVLPSLQQQQQPPQSPIRRRVYSHEYYVSPATGTSGPTSTTTVSSSSSSTCSSPTAASSLHPATASTMAAQSSAAAMGVADEPLLGASNNHNHSRFNSRDMPRSYAGQYQSGPAHDLVPLECLRTHHFLIHQGSFRVFLSAYLTLILVLYILAVIWTTTSAAATTATPATTATFNSSVLTWYYQLWALCSRSSWTVTNALHCIVTLAYVHWFKGSYLLLDEQGELNGMTVWEQLEATSESTNLHIRRSLWIVPTVLCYTACLVHNFELVAATVNGLIWSILMLAKLPMMNGVRLFGINRTAGIDDDDDNSSNNINNANDADDISKSYSFPSYPPNSPSSTTPTSPKKHQ